jgi:hypothetical protein
MKEGKVEEKTQKKVKELGDGGLEQTKQQI